MPIVQKAAITKWKVEFNAVEFVIRGETYNEIFITAYSRFILPFYLNLVSRHVPMGG
jgi:hypothetical protein